eukprot:UN08914
MGGTLGYNLDPVGLFTKGRIDLIVKEMELETHFNSEEEDVDVLEYKLKRKEKFEFWT